MDDQEEMEAETQTEIVSIQGDYRLNKDKVIDYLIERTLDVMLEIPKVVRGDFSGLE